MSAAKNLDGILDLLADAVAQRVLAKIIRQDRGPAVYTTGKDGPHIPGRTRRWMVENLKAIPGARKVGRVWEIPAEKYEAWATDMDTRRCTPRRPASSSALSVHSEDSNDREARALRSLQSQGYRRSE